MRPVDIVIPFFRNPHLVSRIFASLRRVDDELLASNCHIIAINDSPGDDGLVGILEKLSDTPMRTPLRITANDDNLGFVKSANRGMAQALSRSHDVLLLNSDTVVFPGSLTEVIRIARQDEKIGFVSPRSNNAEICNLPHQSRYRNCGPEEAYQAFLRLSRLLPEWQYVPTAVGFCLFVKLSVLVKCGLFDEGTYGHGYQEENDLIMRASRAGYRAVLANRAFVYHEGKVSFGSTEPAIRNVDEQHLALLDGRYPEFRRSIESYWRCPRVVGEELLGGLIPNSDGRTDIILDFSEGELENPEAYEFTRQLVQQAAECWNDRYRLYVLSSAWHKTPARVLELANITVLAVPPKRHFAAAIHIGQVNGEDDLRRMARLAPVNVYLITDNSNNSAPCFESSDRNTALASVFAHADAIIYPSEFLRRQYSNRFKKRESLLESVVRPSLIPSEYDRDLPPRQSCSSKIVVITGTPQDPVARRMSRAWPDVTVVSLRDPFRGERVPARHTYELWDRLFIEGRTFVISPSYCGNGLSIVKALAFQKPVYAFSSPALRELHERVTARKNFHLVSSVPKLFTSIDTMPIWIDDDRAECGREIDSWRTAAHAVRNTIDAAIGALSYDKVLLPRTTSLHNCEPSVADRLPIEDESRTEQIRTLEAAVKEYNRGSEKSNGSWLSRLTGSLRRMPGWPEWRKS